MKTKKKSTTQRTCIDCGKNISDLHHHAVRCKDCSKKRKLQQDQQRQQVQRKKTIQWLSFIENPETQELQHRSAKGSKLRYWLDKICRELTLQDLDFLILLWKWRAHDAMMSEQQRREYRTCAGIVRDWRDYMVFNKIFTGVSYDAETGVIFNTDGSYLTVDFDEDREDYIVRNSEGTIICRY